MGDYLQVLIWTMLFVVIVEMIFPSSDMKKYLKLVLGFIVIYMILSPVAEKVMAMTYIPGDSVSQYVNYYQEALGQDVTYSQYEEEMEKQQKGMLDIYTNQMKKQIQMVVEQQVKVEVVDVALEIIKQGVTFEIEKLELEVRYKEEDIQGWGIGVGSKNESIVLDQDQLEKQIKKCLKDFYNWDNTNIYITVQEN